MYSALARRLPPALVVTALLGAGVMRGAAADEAASLDVDAREAPRGIMTAHLELPVVAGPHQTKRQILLYTLVLWPVTAAPWLLGTAGGLYAVGAALLNAGFTGAAVQVCCDRSHRSARRMFTLSLLYLLLIFSLLLIDRTGGNWH